jgi:FkbM family methyltransferase
MISFLLKFKFLRDRFKFRFLHSYFNELELTIPVGSGYYAQLLESDSYDSFSEIFIQQEYSDFIPNEHITSVLDLGANFGYFSLWLQTKRPKDKIYSTLIDPSLRCSRSLKKLVNLPQLQKRFQYLPLAIGDPNKPHIKFYDRHYMAGSIFESDRTDSYYNANTLKTSNVFTSDRKSFDLIKCDIEGGEWEFIVNYILILQKSKFLLMEWHSWHSGGGGFSQIEKKLVEIGFQVIKSSTPQKAIGRDGEVGLFLAKNLNFQN